MRASILTFAIAVGGCAFPAYAAETIQYRYDALGRLIEVKVAAGKTRAYSYDAVGNRIQTAVTTSTAAVAAPTSNILAAASARAPIAGGVR